MRKHVRRRVTVLLMLLLIAAAAPANLAARPSPQAVPATIPPIYLPLVQGPPSLAGVFDCVETEFELGWTTDVVTLNPNGISLYQYGPPATSTISGTWEYIQATQTISFTKFRWDSATVQDPDHFSNRRFLPQQGFFIGILCSRRTAALAAAYG